VEQSAYVVDNGNNSNSIGTGQLNVYKLHWLSSCLDYRKLLTLSNPYFLI